jgi:hypothetical protein
MFEMKTSRALMGVVCVAMVASGGACFAQTQLVSDNFKGPSYAYLGSNWAGCGYEGGKYSKLMTINNQAGGSGYSSQNCAVYTGYGNFPNDQYATVTIVGTLSKSPEVAIELRGNATSSTHERYIACGWDAQDFPSNSDYRIWSLAPRKSPVSLWLSKIAPAINDVIWCQVSGTTVTMKVNGVVLQSVRDNSGLVSGYPGLYYIDPNAGSPSLSDVIFNNFAAGIAVP